ncbi:hypothetical protein VCO01S_11240 [Vibrio comitans NBRC 102076]|uniref:Uncharacterized protein n=1 Tax=Vibrio comitans NBRC 102076 TaxID=1219078 RepID=A0A4Y3IKF1_9VIBR|nr:hypothetical protein VCO01S_11240 [Vibrio comitans NBRC 102076]
MAWDFAQLVGDLKSNRVKKNLLDLYQRIGSISAEKMLRSNREQLAQNLNKSRSSSTQNALGLIRYQTREQIRIKSYALSAFWV